MLRLCPGPLVLMVLAVVGCGSKAGLRAGNADAASAAGGAQGPDAVLADPSDAADDPLGADFGGAGAVPATGGAIGSGGAPGTGGLGGTNLGSGGWVIWGTGGAGSPPNTGGQLAVDSGTGSGGQGATACTAGENPTCFADGRALGVLNGDGFVKLGALDLLTSPVCDDTTNGRRSSEPITNEQPCPETGRIVWSSSDALCISGAVPVVTGGNYAGNWGVQAGAYVSDPPGGTLGRKYKSITMTWDDGKISPYNTAIRAVVHRKEDDIGSDFCATIANGAPASFIAFNTQCWDGSGVALTEDDVANIDSIAIQVSSDDKKEYTITDFCLRLVELGQPG